MTYKGLDAQICKVVAETFKMNVSDVSSETSMNNLKGWDSMSHLSLVLSIERAFEVRFRPDELRGLTSIEALRTALIKKGVPSCRS